MPIKSKRLAARLQCDSPVIDVYPEGDTEAKRLIRETAIRMYPKKVTVDPYRIRFADAERVKATTREAKRRFSKTLNNLKGR